MFLDQKKGMKNFLDDLYMEDSELSNNFLLNSIKSLDINNFIKFSEPNRRALNLLLDLQNRNTTTRLLLEACIFREESRGGHYRTDYPEKLDSWKCHSRQIKTKKIQKRFT